MDMQTLFDVRGLTPVITGGSGQFGRVMAQGLAGAGVRVAVVSLNANTSGTVVEAIRICPCSFTFPLVRSQSSL